MKRKIQFVLAAALAITFASADVFAQNQIPNTSVGQTPQPNVAKKKSVMSRDYSEDKDGKVDPQRTGHDVRDVENSNDPTQNKKNEEQNNAVGAGSGARVATSDLASDMGILEAVAAEGHFKTFNDALAKADLKEELKGDEKYTIFAPTDAAFYKMSVSKREMLMKEENKEKLEALLKSHIVKGEYKTSDLKDGQTLTTISGKKLRVSQKGNQWYIENSAISAADVAATNGTVYGIDDVVLLDEKKDLKNSSQKSGKSGVKKSANKQ